MGFVLLKGNQTLVEGDFSKKGDRLHNFTFCTEELETVSLETFSGKKKVLATVPSVDTAVCEEESIFLNSLAKKYPSVDFLVISKDSPFALKRFCHDKSLENIIALSDTRSASKFSSDYGVKLTSGPLDGFLARSLIYVDENNQVLYSELVSEISSKPNFDLLEKSILENK